MQIHYSKRSRNGAFWRRAAVACALAMAAGRAPAAAEAQKLTAVPEWHRFERAFRSDTIYANPLQEARLTVTFVSPLGETNAVEGFWDGGRTWRVRFAPGEAGRWTYKTVCTDWGNKGLHNQKGEFLCTSPIGESRFHQHGPVRVALDRRHLEHADGTPFFWLADTAWNGARMSEPKDWEKYAVIRASQEFTVVQWAAAPGGDAQDESALGGFSEKVTINPAFFQRLDAKVEELSEAGLLSAIVPFWETEARAHEGVPLPDEQIGLLTRYVVARYGAEPVAWLVALEGDTQKKEWVWQEATKTWVDRTGDPVEKLAARWKRIGAEVFGKRRHAPVVLFAGQTPGLLEKFRGETWVDVLGYPAATEGSDEARRAWLAGQREKEPARMWIPFAPFENGLKTKSGKRFAAAEVRRAVYTSLLLTAPAGVSYGAQGVANWDTAVDQKAGAGAGLPLWEKALFMPAAKQMTVLANLMESIDFWQLRPAPQFVAQQPGDSSPQNQLAAEARADKKLAIVYVPQERTLDLGLEALPSAPSVIWLNPSSGKKNPAVAVVGGSTCRFPTPEAGDWVLEMKSGKP